MSRPSGPEHEGRLQETRVDVARDLDLGTAEVEAQRVERAEAAVDGRRAADRDDHTRRAGFDRCADQLAGPERRRADRVVGGGDERQTARARHLDIAGAPSEPPLRLDGSTEGARHGRSPPVSWVGAEHVERPFPSVGEGKGDCVRPGPPCAGREGVRGFAGRQAAAELVGTAENRVGIVKSSRSEVWQRLGTPTPVDGRSTFPAVLRREPRGVATRPSSARSWHRDGTDTSHVSR